MGIIKLGSQIAAELFDSISNVAGFVAEFLSPAPPSQNGDIIPFEPPFLGGQCSGGYFIEAKATYPNGTIQWGYLNGNSSVQRSESEIRAGSIAIAGTVNSIEQFVQFNGSGLRFNGGERSIFFGFQGNEYASSIEVNRLIPIAFPSDSCGNLPNPNPSPPTPESGISKAPFPDIDSGGEILVEGIAPLALPAGLAGALQALGAAANLAALAGALAGALQALDEAARGRNNEGEPDPDDKEDPDGKPSKIRYTYGFIEGDGYINLYPEDNNRYEGIYLDIILSNIPVGFGKEFGNKAPHRYKFRKLGWVAFVSPSFSLFNFEELQFVRTCLPIPEGAVGFYYHLGLDKEINGGAVGYLNKYLNEEPN